MGFAIQRTDLTEDETTWLRGNKTFPSIRPSTGFEDASSHEHPFQAFQWADYCGQARASLPLPRDPDVRPSRRADAKARPPAVAIETEPLAGAQARRAFQPRGHRVAGVCAALPGP